MNWRFVAFGWAGYLLVWGLAAYLAIAVVVTGQPVNLREVASAALLFAPFGTFVGLLIAADHR